MKRRLLFLPLAFALAVVAGPAQAQQRVALVIGNSEYRDGVTRPLAAGDATAVAQMLRSIDFQVILGTNLDLDGMTRLREQFKTAVEPAETALVYFSGRGIQVGASHFMLPVDAKWKTLAELEASTIGLDSIIKFMAATSRDSLIFFDADRDSPIPTRRLPIPTGPAPAPPANILIMYATAQGTHLPPAGDGPHSALATTLLKNFPALGANFDAVVAQMRREVMAATDGRQTPWTERSLPKGVVLFPAPTDAAKKP